ncbi:cytochrome c biogenesis protein CcsA [bacterium]|nr:cytochrome c biogenesis protein CcsA [bacterium]
MLLIFAVSIGIATFIENDFGTETAQRTIYKAKWLEVLLLLLVINLISQIIQHRLWKKGKRLSLIFHSAWIILFMGGGITRYFGVEGFMHIREGGVADRMTTSDAVFQVTLESQDDQQNWEKPLLISEKEVEDFHKTFDLNGEKVAVRYKNFIPYADVSLIDDSLGQTVVLLSVSGGEYAENLIVKESKISRFNDILFALNHHPGDSLPGVLITLKDEELVLSANQPIEITSMKDPVPQSLQAGVEHPLDQYTIYKIGNLRFALKDFLSKGRIQAVPVSSTILDNTSNQFISSLIIEVEFKNQVHEIALFENRGYEMETELLELNESLLEMEYGYRSIPLPFSLQLNDFEITRYPGSDQPSSFTSRVFMVDEERGVERPYAIYMNHILNYRGYRFYQASYDEDERGTILSVNRDPGTPVTYFGYFLLFFALLANLFNPQSRFRKLGKTVKQLQVQKQSLPILLITGISILTSTIPLQAQSDRDRIIAEIGYINKTHAKHFGELMIQDVQGRIKPVDTFSREIMHKLVRADHLLGLNANQVILGMMANERTWQRVPIIPVGHKEIHALLGTDPEQKNLSLLDFFDPESGRFILADPIEAANQKRLVERNNMDKELIKLGEQVQICYMLNRGLLYRFFPAPDDPEQTWTYAQNAITTFPETEAEIIYDMIESYLIAVRQENWVEADEVLSDIKTYQITHGAAIYPTPTKIKAEILFNQLNIFERLMLPYLVMGGILLILAFVQLIKPIPFDIWLRRGFFTLLILGFLIHTSGLGLRWFVSGHAPLSNGYEAIVFASWATVLAGLLFSKKEAIPLATSSILAGVLLFVAHLSWMDPQITNLVPILKSYWLMLHVSVVTASYGFLGLGALLAVFTLLLIILRTEKNGRQIDLSIHLFTQLNERTLTVGLVLVTIGTFLGAIWANESWGRYWGWDPKETWALIIIITYTVVLHLRLIPKIFNLFLYNVAALLAFGSVAMTFWGVNYYLSGLHSYAQGDTVPIPFMLYIILIVITVIIGLAYRKCNRIQKPS